MTNAEIFFKWLHQVISLTVDFLIKHIDLIDFGNNLRMKQSLRSLLAIIQTLIIRFA
ncbi:MAG: hypothetical protein SNJ64_01605 [Endomicrobiia bacterium]